MAVNFPENFYVKRRRSKVGLCRGRSKSYIVIAIAIATAVAIAIAIDHSAIWIVGLLRNSPFMIN